MALTPIQVGFDRQGRPQKMISLPFGGGDDHRVYVRTMGPEVGAAGTRDWHRGAMHSPTPKRKWNGGKDKAEPLALVDAKSGEQAEAASEPAVADLRSRSQGKDVSEADRRGRTASEEAAGATEGPITEGRHGVASDSPRTQRKKVNKKQRQEQYRLEAAVATEGPIIENAGADAKCKRRKRNSEQGGSAETNDAPVEPAVKPQSLKKQFKKWLRARAEDGEDIEAFKGWLKAAADNL